MTRQTIVVDDALVTVSDDLRATVRHAQWAIAMARVVDELTGHPPDRVLTVRTVEPVLTMRLGEDGRIGVLVQPWDRYPLFSAGFAAHVTLTAPGFLPRRLSIPIVRVLALAAVAGDTILTVDTADGIRPGQPWVIGDTTATHEPVSIGAVGPGPNQLTLASPLGNPYLVGAPLAPGPLTSVDLGDVALHRTSVVVRGRVTVFLPATQTWQPSPTATLTLSAIWRRQADVTNELAKEAPAMVSIAPGLYLDRTAVADSLQPVTVNAVAGDDKTTRAAVIPTATQVDVSNAKGLAVGALIQVDVEHPDVAEILPVAAVAPVGTVDEPAEVTLGLPFAANHRAGVGVRHVNTANTLVAKALHQDGLAGDPMAFLTDVAFGGTPAVARVGSGPTAEYHAVSLYTAATDADGYFEFPPLSRIAKVRIVANVPLKPPQEIDLQPDYQAVEQWLNVRVV